MRAARGTPERSTQGTDHCHQMLLLSLLPRILRQPGGGGEREPGKKGSDLPFSGCFFFFFFPPLFRVTTCHSCMRSDARLSAG